MTDNTHIVRALLSFTDKDDFYFVQVLKRRKDNPDLSRDMIVIGNYYIESLEQFDKIVPQIVKICDVENARAYIRLNKRNYKHLAHHMLKRVVDVVTSGAYRSLKGTFDSVAGEYHNDKDKTWVIDLDDDKNLNAFEVSELVTVLQKEAKREPLTLLIPTKNGKHLITRPFNLQKFREKFPEVDVHKDNPTILYCP
jgi:hypothetical protein